jgi:hypothetical protein
MLRVRIRKNDTDWIRQNYADHIRQNDAHLIRVSNIAENTANLQIQNKQLRFPTERQKKRVASTKGLLPGQSAWRP